MTFSYRLVSPSYIYTCIITKFEVYPRTIRISKMFRVLTTLLVYFSIINTVKHSALAIVCDVGRYATPTGCKKCPKGTFNGKLSNATSCNPCKEGTYAEKRGTVSSQLCLECPPDSVSPAGASSCKRCTDGYVRACDNCVRCPPGTEIRPFGSCGCEKCSDRSYYAPDWNTDFCIPCPYGLVASDDHTKCVPADCGDGYEFDGYECIPCEYNTYRKGNMTQCEECPFGLVTNDFSGPNSDCIICPAGSYTTDSVSQTFTFESVPFCLNCPANTTTRAAGQTLCRRIGSPCAPNSVKDFDGDCKTCDYNHRFKYKTRTCVPCSKGYYAPRGALKQCLKCPHKSTAGLYGRCGCNAGLGLRNGTCQPCAAGTASGFFSNECTPCSPGQIAPREGMPSCIDCPEGTRTVRTDRTKCVAIPKCKPGFIFSNMFLPFADPECISVRSGCVEGLKRVTRKRTTVCVDAERGVVCPPGSVYDNVSKCIACGLSYYVKKAPLSDLLKCKRCPLGSISPGGAVTSCTACPTGFSVLRNYEEADYCFCKTGKYVRQSDGACVRCPTGSVNNVWNNTNCEKCVNGFTQDYVQRECQCVRPKVVNRDGKCVDVTNPIDYER